MKKILTNIGKNSVKASCLQVDTKKKNKILKDYLKIIKNSKKKILKENKKDLYNANQKKYALIFKAKKFFKSP